MSALLHESRAAAQRSLSGLPEEPARRRRSRSKAHFYRKLTSMVVPESLTLPNYCYICDATTTRFVTIERSLVEKGENVVVRLLLALFWIWSLLFTGSKSLRTVAIRLPQCSECAGRGKPEPRHVDFERFEMTFVVNRNWRERLRSSKK
jgi:hypothetical protein